MEKEKKKSKLFLIIGIIISIIIIAIIVFSNWQNTNVINKTKPYMDYLANRLEIYKEASTEITSTENKIYPEAESYQALIAIYFAGSLNPQIDYAFLPKAVEPVDDYDYYYCSTDGTAYKLEARVKNKIIISSGNDKCIPANQS